MNYIVLCPGGNSYADAGNDMMAIIMVIWTIFTIMLFGYAIMGYLHKEKNSKWYLLVGFIFMVVTIVLNVVDFIIHI